MVLTGAGPLRGSPCRSCTTWSSASQRSSIPSTSWAGRCATRSWAGSARLRLHDAARPDHIEEAVRDAGRRPYLIGKRFGTVAFRLDGSTVEVTTFRSETYTADTRRPRSSSSPTSNRTWAGATSPSTRWRCTARSSSTCSAVRPTSKPESSERSATPRAVQRGPAAHAARRTIRLAARLPIEPRPTGGAGDSRAASCTWRASAG